MKNFIVQIDPDQRSEVEKALSILQGRFENNCFFLQNLPELTDNDNCAKNALDYRLAGFNYTYLETDSLIIYLNKQNHISN